MSRRRPNILWVCTDQQRADTIRALGNDHIDTPTLDRLCAEGTAFTRAYCQSPVCTPSRASFLTGRYPSAIGINRLGTELLPRNAPLVTKELSANGYVCGLVGKLHLTAAYQGVENRSDDGYTYVKYNHDPWQAFGPGNDYGAWLTRQGIAPGDVFAPAPNGGYRGYRDDIRPELHQTKWVADEAIAFIEANGSGPWLLSLNFFDPHPPFDAPAEYRRRYATRPLPEPVFGESDLPLQQSLADVYFQTRPEAPPSAARARTAAYYGMVTFLDEQLGRVLDALDRSGQRSDTLIVFMSDHGEMLGDHGLTLKGCRFYQGLVNVPLIFSWPGVVQGGTFRDDLVELTDVAPTLAEFAGLELAGAQGRSLVSCLTAGSATGRGHVRSEYIDALNPQARSGTRPAKRTVGSMYFDGRYKLTVYHSHGTGELYDLRDDPGETTNLWSSAEAATIKARLLQEAFDASMLALDDGPPAKWPY